MVFAFWGPKGGVGTSTTAAAFAVGLASHSTTGVLLVDATGDLPALLGLAEPATPGVGDWLGATAQLPADALGRLAVPLQPGFDLLSQGEIGPVSAERVELLSVLLANDDRDVVIDCGVLHADAWQLPLARLATRSLMVLRPCYLAIRKAMTAPLRAQGVVLICELGRALDQHDIEAVLGVPVVVKLPYDPAIARAVDAGLLVTRLPKTFRNSWGTLV